MPTILRIKGYRFYFYASDRNEPAHVHVTKEDKVAKIWLEPELEPKYFYNFKSKEQKEIIGLCKSNFNLLKSKWHEFFKK